MATTRAGPLRFIGSNVGEAAAFAIGAATAPAVRPLLQDLTNLTWGLHPVRPPDAGTLANGVAQGQVDPGDAAVWAAQQGIGAEAFAALVHIADTGPGVPAAFELWRRNLITDAAWKRALKRQAIEPEWITALEATKTMLLQPAEIANAVQQGHLPNPGIIPTIAGEVPAIGGQVDPLAPDGHPPQDVPLTTIDLNPITEAEGSGVDLDRLKVKTNLAGLPPGAAELLTMWNRGIITEEAVDAGIREGHTKTKWTGPVKRLKWAVLGAAEYAGAHLRGWITEAEMYAGGRLTGHTKEQMDLLYLNRGRPLAPVQAYTAWARKSPGPQGPGYDRGPHDFDEQDFLRALRQSDIRTEYGPTLWANRFAYPPLFQINRLVQGHAITAATAIDWAEKSRYAPEVIAALRAYWGAGTVAATKELTKAELLTEYDGLYITEAELLTALQGLGLSPEAAQMEAHLVDARRVKAARDKVVKAVHDQFVGHAIQRAEAQAYLEGEQLPAEAIDKLLTEWDHEASVARKSLTVAQITRAYRRSSIDRATALQELQDHGYTAADAAVLLDSNLTLPPQAPLP